MEYNFKSMGDAELLKTEYVLRLEVDARMVQMRLDPDLQTISNQLAEIEDEKTERGI